MNLLDNLNKPSIVSEAWKERGPEGGYFVYPTLDFLCEITRMTIKDRVMIEMQDNLDQAQEGATLPKGAITTEEEVEELVEQTMAEKSDDPKIVQAAFRHILYEYMFLSSDTQYRVARADLGEKGKKKQ